MPDGRSACEHGVTCCLTCDPADYMGDDEYEEEPGPGEARCANCGFIVPKSFIEWIDDMYYGQCEECQRGQ